MTDEIRMDGEPLEVGNEVYCLVNGWGKVEELNMGVSTYQIDVNFNGSLGSYTQDFQLFKGTNRTLYWQKPEIIPPPKPRKKIKAWDWVSYCSDGFPLFIHRAMTEQTVLDSGLKLKRIEGTEREVER